MKVGWNQKVNLWSTTKLCQNYKKIHYLQYKVIFCVIVVVISKKSTNVTMGWRYVSRSLALVQNGKSLTWQLKVITAFYRLMVAPWLICNYTGVSDYIGGHQINKLSPTTVHTLFILDGCCRRSYYAWVL